jgi:hypothetical protein
MPKGVEKSGRLIKYDELEFSVVGYGGRSGGQSCGIY